MTGRLPRDHGILSASTLPAPRLGQRVGPAAQGGARRGARARGPRLAPARRLHLAAAARPVERPRRVRHPDRPRAGLGHAPAGDDPRLRRVSLLPPAARRPRARREAPSTRATSSPEIAARAVGPPRPRPRAPRRPRRTPAPPRRRSTTRSLRALAEDALAPDLTYARAAEVLRQAYDPLAPRRLVPRLRRGRAHVLPLRAPRGLRQRGRGRGAPLRPRARPLRRRSWSAGWGRSSGRLGPGDVLVVVSGHGLAPTPLWRRLVGALTGTASAAATHAGAPDGVLLVVGRGNPARARPARRVGARRRPDAPLPDGPAGGSRHGGPGPHRDPRARRSRGSTRSPSSRATRAWRWPRPRPGAPLDDLPPLPEERP